MEQKGTKSSPSTKEISQGKNEKNPMKDVSAPKPIVSLKYNNDQSHKETRSK